MPWLPVIHSPDEELEFFRNQVLPDQTVIVADNMDQVAGFAAYTHGWLNHLYVAPDAWRGGIGSELLRQVQAASSSELLRQVQAASSSLQLWTFQGNTTARRFYARFRFEEVEFTNGRRNEEKMPDVRMVWRQT
ncbi:MAG: GNAT family N-acetyltransferase [Hyphomonas sp.]|nr:GNAT family N-acetyltransferase [Hyphomonas sp.]|tara:strand:+ start:4523 stop:4924 length:402 start_codon:yes stop_codon:yes gene_type:complete